MSYQQEFNCSECTSDVPCLRHVGVSSERILNSPQAQAFFLSQVKSDLDLAGPEDDESCLSYVGESQTEEDRAWGHEHLTGHKR